jgi:hypothetical protein
VRASETTPDYAHCSADINIAATHITAASHIIYLRRRAASININRNKRLNLSPLAPLPLPLLPIYIPSIYYIYIFIPTDNYYTIKDIQAARSLG